ncbi:hypothetical protein C6341_g23208 [Phytophthora cactorum]|nr:hypothetical protein C6341_g23208 [Phytophthora cactorum]
MVVSTQVLQATGNTIHRNLLGLYHGIYGGAAGFTYGCNSVWLMYEPRADLVSDAIYYDPQINQNDLGSWRNDIVFKGTTQIQYPPNRCRISPPMFLKRSSLPILFSPVPATTQANPSTLTREPATTRSLCNSVADLVVALALLVGSHLVMATIARKLR